MCHSNVDSHADIKPENILVELNRIQPSKMKFHLTDFSCSLTHREYKRGAISGSVAYLSVEMFAQLFYRQAFFPSENCVDSYSMSLVALFVYDQWCISLAAEDVRMNSTLCQVSKQFREVYQAFESKVAKTVLFHFMHCVYYY